MKKSLFTALAVFALSAIGPTAALADDLPTGSDEVISEGNRDATTAAAEYEAAYDNCMAQNCLDYGPRVIYTVLPLAPGAIPPTTPTEPKKDPTLNCKQLRERQEQLGSLIRKWTQSMAADGLTTWTDSALVSGQSYRDADSWTLVRGASKIVYLASADDGPSWIAQQGTAITNTYDNVSKALQEKCFKTTTTR